MTRRLTPPELHLLQRVYDAGGSHCFSAEDNIPAAGHRALRSLAYRGLLSVDSTDDGPLVKLLPMGLAEVDHG